MQPLSTTRGRKPTRLASMAQASPVGPAPMQITSYVSAMIQVCPERMHKFNSTRATQNRSLAQFGFLAEPDQADGRRASFNSRANRRSSANRAEVASSFSFFQTNH